MGYIPMEEVREKAQLQQERITSLWMLYEQSPRSSVSIGVSKNTYSDKSHVRKKFQNLQI